MIRPLIVASVVLMSVLSLTSCGPRLAPLDEGPAPQTEADTSTNVTKATLIVDQIASGQFARVTDAFDATMKAALPEATLATTWAQLQKQAGAFKERTTVREAQEQGYATVYVTCIFERATLNAKVVFNDESQVSALFFLPL